MTTHVPKQPNLTQPIRKHFKHTSHMYKKFGGQIIHKKERWTHQKLLPFLWKAGSLKSLSNEKLHFCISMVKIHVNSLVVVNGALCTWSTSHVMLSCILTMSVWMDALNNAIGDQALTSQSSMKNEALPNMFQLGYEDIFLLRTDESSINPVPRWTIHCLDLFRILCLAWEGGMDDKY